jgi:hypothetical protein
MYAMCHTKSNDVVACIQEMKNRNAKYPILQVGQKLYNQCDKDRSKAMEIAGNKKRHFVINMSSGMVHRKGCEIAKRTNKECLIGAYLVRPKDTGLKMCKSCMS